MAAGAQLDPLAPARPGRWEDADVVVCHAERVPAGLAPDRPAHAVTEHFEVHRPGEQLLVVHRMRPDELDDDLAGLLARELAAPGLLETAATFERVFTGVVRSTVDDPLAAWSLFYANTLAALRRFGRPGADDPPPPAQSSIAAFAPVHHRARELVAGRSVLDLGSCFGFFPLRLAEDGYAVTASDLSLGTMGLLTAVTARSGAVLRSLVCDARSLPSATGGADTVTAVHLLEHLEPDDGARALAEMVRVARRRVVVAVPVEEVPEPVYGHVRCFDADVLDALGRGTGLPYRVEDYHGGWLVVDAD